MIPLSVMHSPPLSPPLFILSFLFFHSFVFPKGVISSRISIIEAKQISCDKPRDFTIINVRSLDLPISRFVCSFLTFRLIFHSLFPFLSREKWIAKILAGACSHFNCKEWIAYLLLIYRGSRHLGFILHVASYGASKSCFGCKIGCKKESGNRLFGECNYSKS